MNMLFCGVVRLVKFVKEPHHRCENGSIPAFIVEFLDGILIIPVKVKC